MASQYPKILDAIKDFVFGLWVETESKNRDIVRTNNIIAWAIMLRSRLYRLFKAKVEQNKLCESDVERLRYKIFQDLLIDWENTGQEILAMEKVNVEQSEKSERISKLKKKEYDEEHRKWKELYEEVDDDKDHERWGELKRMEVELDIFDKNYFRFLSNYNQENKKMPRRIVKIHVDFVKRVEAKLNLIDIPVYGYDVIPDDPEWGKY